MDEFIKQGLIYLPQIIISSMGVMILILIGILDSSKIVLSIPFVVYIILYWLLKVKKSGKFI